MKRPPFVLLALFAVSGATSAFAQDSVIKRLNALDRDLAALQMENMDLRQALSNTLIASEMECEKLPGQWERAPTAQGRFLLGAGGGYEPGGEGGEPKVTLTIEEMPSHDHTGVFPTGSAHGMLNDPRFHPSARSGSTGISGGNKPHENMPPYRVVYFCRMK